MAWVEEAAKWYTCWVEEVYFAKTPASEHRYRLAFPKHKAYRELKIRESKLYAHPEPGLLVQYSCPRHILTFHTSAPPPSKRDRSRRARNRHNFAQGEAAGHAPRSATGARGTGARSTQGNCKDLYCQGLQHGSKVAKACGTFQTALLGATLASNLVYPHLCAGSKLCPRSVRYLKAAANSELEAAGKGKHPFGHSAASGMPDSEPDDEDGSEEDKDEEDKDDEDKDEEDRDEESKATDASSSEEEEEEPDDLADRDPAAR